MKGRRIPYSQTELNWVRDNCTLPVAELHQAFCERFNRDDVSASNLNALRKRNGWKTGRTGQFQKGQVSWNKGKPMPYNANSAKTQFKKGQTPHNTNYLGHERVSKDGYVEVSIAETNPHTGYERRYVHKHRHEWEKANGPIPDGHALKCMDGDKTNCDPSNWELISRALLPKLTRKRRFESLPNELKPTALAVTKLEHKAQELMK